MDWNKGGESPDERLTAIDTRAILAAVAVLCLIVELCPAPYRLAAWDVAPGTARLAALPLTASISAPGPLMLTLLFTTKLPLLSVIVPVTEKSIVSPSAAAASASRSRHPAPGQFPAVAAPSPVLCTVMVVA